MAPVMSEWPSETKRMCELRMEPPLVMSAFAMTGLSMYISNSDAWKMPGKKYQITLDRQFNYITLPMMMGLVPMEDGVYIVSASSVRRIRDTKGQLRWIPTQNGRNTAESGYDVSPTRGSMSFDIWLEPKPRMPQRDHPERAIFFHIEDIVSPARRFESTVPNVHVFSLVQRLKPHL
ncbi:hypothetical protein CIRG_03445 [Coccidioides immitis RMSCC 2394]|uniref:Uncharacterized protein n=1 Tax=Coccidioides immitis RMSCC 2394 TaxID=404692 RepID=A0A0J6YAE7_COCIT|nr:hypothetical protein CIRG_03445 [Coccidioides immitis RMSCC 2394]